MKQQTTSGIILSRTNFGEADRILTVLTPDSGKLRLMAKGVRRAGAKLAGSVELFSISDITFIRGRGDIGILTSARLRTHFGSIIKDIDRVTYGYEMLKLLDSNTEDNADEDYFNLLAGGLAALDDMDLPIFITKLFFEASLLRLAGHAPNLDDDAAGRALSVGRRYSFSTSDGFDASASGEYNSRDIKFLRVVFAGNSPRALSRVTDAETLARECQALVRAMLGAYLRVSG